MTKCSITATALLLICSLAFASELPKHPEGLRWYYPGSISSEAQAIYRILMPGVAANWGKAKLPSTPEEFAAIHKANLESSIPGAEAAITAAGAAVREFDIEGVKVLEILPANFTDDGTVLLRVHGGGFVIGSARSSMKLDAIMGIATGKRIISIDYTVAPLAQWQKITDQIIQVYKHYLESGYAPDKIGFFGDSAGGTIIASSLLKLRDSAVPLPGAVVLLSPCTDLTQSGDTNKTLTDADPVLSPETIHPGFEAYADKKEWKNPYVSPVYGDFKKGFPPTLIQVGTKEMLLSDSVRLYQAIKQSGGSAILDVYEGMSHVFQSYMADTPEQKHAIAEAVRFWDANLK